MFCMIVFCVVRLLSKDSSVRFRQKEVMSVTSVAPIVGLRTVFVLYHIVVKSAR